MLNKYVFPSSQCWGEELCDFTLIGWETWKAGEQGTARLHLFAWVRVCFKRSSMV